MEIFLMIILIIFFMLQMESLTPWEGLTMSDNIFGIRINTKVVREFVQGHLSKNSATSLEIVLSEVSSRLSFWWSKEQSKARIIRAAGRKYYEEHITSEYPPEFGKWWLDPRQANLAEQLSREAYEAWVKKILYAAEEEYTMLMRERNRRKT